MQQDETTILAWRWVCRFESSTRGPGNWIDFMWESVVSGAGVSPAAFNFCSGQRAGETLLQTLLLNRAVTPFAEVASNSLEVSIMSKLAIWAEVEAKPGKEQAVAEFLKSSQALAEKEQGTITWYAVKLGGAKFGIFDTFADEKGREAHLNGEIAKALFGKAQELFVKEPQVHKLEILAAKVPGGAKAYGA
jgi:quinol monooxygenase YgiN